MENSIYFPSNNFEHTLSLAANLFERTSRPNWRRFLPGRFRVEERPLPILPRETTRAADTVETHTRRVALHQVSGSVTLARGGDFDADFRPINKHLKDRWIRVAQACLQHKVLPPVKLLKVNDAYFVVDGHHRVSVAKSLGHDEILAWVSN